LKIEGRKYFLAFFPVVATNQIFPQSDCKNKINYQIKTGYEKIDTGSLMLDTRYWILDTGYWILDTG
jgi:hypothetical protein